MQRVLILGGYGAFGGLVAQRLAQVPGIEVIVAGRSEAKAQAFAARYRNRQMSQLSAKRTALIVVDVQKAFDEWEASGKRRNNPDAIKRIAELLADFRAKGAPVIHIRHASLEPGSRFQVERPGYAVKEEAREREGEPVIVKHANSAFIGTDLEACLRQAAIDTVVMVGATTNHCVETTTRMAGNLGFNAKLVRDATWTFDRDGADGEHFTAEQVHAMTLANLRDEFAEIATAADIRRRLVMT